MRKRPVDQDLLHRRLDELTQTFDLTTIEPDPLQLVHRYRDPLDQEIAGLVAAAFAYGRADIVVRNAGSVLAAMTPAPRAYLEAFDPREASRRFAGFSHRFHKTPELVALLTCVAGALATYGSLGEVFRSGYHDGDDDIAPALTSFVNRILSFAPPASDEVHDGLRYLLTSPADGSACKRMNLLLRWMVRRTPPDLGIWDFVDPAKLVIPLDTHVHRIAAFLGLNGRRTPDWKAARALTDRLAKFDPADPVRYDFAICRLGILDLCSRKRRKENCDVCLLRDVCRFPML